MPQSLVLIVPADQKPVAEAVSTVLGHQQPGDETYVVALSSTGADPATHYGCHTWATPQFVGLVTSCQAQSGLPAGVPWGAAGTNEAAVYAMCAALIVSIREDGQHLGHFDDVVAANGLQKVIELVD